MQLKCVFLSFLFFLLSGCETVNLQKVSLSLSEDKNKIENIFSILDAQMQGSDEYLKYLDDNVILMAHNAPLIKGKKEYVQHIKENRSYGVTNIEHKLLEIYPYQEIIVVRGKAVGSFRANGSSENISFETKNVFIFRRLENGELKIWQTIFNMNP